MKKLLAILLAVIMVLGMVACAAKTETPAAETPKAEEPKKEEPKAEEPKAEEPKAEAPAEAIEITYYCSHGNFGEILQKEIDKWNEGEGKEKGVFLNLVMNVNNYSADLEALMQAGNYFDIDDLQEQKYLEQGFIQDWAEIGAAYPEVQALIDSYEPYMTSEKTGDVIRCLPMEIVPIKFAINTDLFEKNNLEYPKTWEDIYNCAKVITENGNGEEFGMGWSTWSAMYRRLIMKGGMDNYEKAWWDANTETYSFAQYEGPLNYVKKMYEEGLLLGTDDLAIDPIRAEFAKGRVGMFLAPAYDYAVYTSQFPAECNWTVIEIPEWTEGSSQYKRCYMSSNRGGCSISKPAWDAADQAKKDALVAAVLFLNSDELYAEFYRQGAIIPVKPEIVANNTPYDYVGPQWALFADATNYYPAPVYPDGLLLLDGDNYATVMGAYIHGDLGDDWAPVAADLEERYNAAYEALKSDGITDLTNYTAPWDHTK